MVPKAHGGGRLWQQMADIATGTAESSHLEPQTGRREADLEMDLKTLPQGHSSSRKATPPEPSQIVPPTGKHVFEGPRVR